MIAIVLAVLSGLVWGVGDFAGGKASQRADAVLVVVLSKAASLPLLALYLLFMPAAVQPRTLVWGAAAGVLGVLGMFAFYRALAGGAMAIVAPVSAVTAALLPVAFGLASGERPGALALTGAACAIAAIGLVSAAGGGPAGRVTGRLVGLALLSGAAFGLFFTCLSRAGDEAGGQAGLWPIAGAQVASLALGVPLAVRRWRAGRTGPAGVAGPTGIAGVAGVADPSGVAGAVRPTGAALRWLVLAGALDMSANALYLLAVGRGDLSIIAPVASLYPISTVLLAMLIDRERMRPVQLAGLGLAATALILVAS
ncbi:EamA family transporter [Dactylosporangium sp. NPDC000555]|uniref:EamA family transporter n=1 Tax=Dactylosporangium sp. NPDC000555 TaxID=3154260 RepID=UPI00332C4EFA